jgi:pimeloyl-ACP methyl ester carboxylesterase
VTAFVLVPGAGGAAWYWHRVVPLLTDAGHTAVAVDLRGEDPERGLPEYAETVRAAMTGLTDVVLVGQSMGAFTVPMALTPAVRGAVLLNGMVPCPGETPGAWWEATGQPAAMAAADAAAGRAGFDVETHFLHDVPAVVLATGADQAREPAGTPFGQPCEFDRWSVPVRSVAGVDDRFFPVAFQRRLARERLGVELEEIPGGHLAALSRPAAVVSALLESA